MKKRRIFISFDHDDYFQVAGFLGLRNIIESFDFYNHKLDRRIESNDVEYVRRIIREEYIRPASVTVVLIGDNTANSEWVPWEIQESIRQDKGILGIYLKDSTGAIPSDIPSGHVGRWQPENFANWIEWAYKQSLRYK